MSSLYYLREMPFSRLFWGMVLLAAVLCEGIALGYQYLLHEDPCSICVRIRALVGLIGLTGLFGMALAGQRRVLFVLPLVVLFGSVLKISMLAEQAVKIERGTLFSTCGMDAGFPTWMQLDSWWPAVFEPTGLCGKVVSLIPGWQAGPSMSEALHYGAMTMLVLLAFMVFQSIVLMIVSKPGQ